MKNIQESVLKALGTVLGEDVVEKVSSVITNTLEEATKEIEDEYQIQLNDAYKSLHEELQNSEKQTNDGYSQAFDLICEYKDRLTLQKSELETERDEGFQEAWEMLESERSKNDDVEQEIYKEYEEKLADIQKFLVKKLDQFLPTQGSKYYEAARKDLLNDPVFAEHKVAFEKMLEAAATVLTDEDFSVAVSGKGEVVAKDNEDLKKQVQMLEGKNMRLRMDNNKLTETVRRTSANLLTEHKVERKNRIEKGKKVEGRGERELDRQVVISEQTDEEPVASRSKDSNRRLNEQAQEVASYWNYMAGIDKADDEE